MADSFSKLTEAVKRRGLTESQFTEIVFSLSPAQRRLFVHLNDHDESSTIEVRTQCSIGNVSECARELNDKLRGADDTRRVVCVLKEHRNVYGGKGVLGYWRLVEGLDQQAVA